MAGQSIDGLKRCLRRLCDEAAPPDDAALLARFVAAADRDAFERLVDRHGPMVLGTARRVAGNAHDAEDVFQAVFLSLARLANTVRRGNALPAWLYATTCRVAAKARKRRVLPVVELSQQADPADQLAWREVRQTLDEELQRLPERLRAPLVLCYLAGLTRDEAAKELGWSLGTLKRRLEAGRTTLRARLERRGVAAAGLALAVLTPEALVAAVRPELQAAVLSSVLSPAATPASVSSLVLESSAKGLAMKSIFAALAAGAVGVGLYAGAGQADPPKKVEDKVVIAKPAGEEKPPDLDDPLPAGSVLRFGTSRFRQGPTIETMAVAADGKTAYVVSGTRSNATTRAIDLTTGKTVFSVRNGDGEGIAVAPDGKTVVTKQNQTLDVLDAKTGKSLRVIDLPKANPRSTTDVLAFTPDGKAVATISGGEAVHLIDVETGKSVRDFTHDNPESSNGFPQVLAVAFSADGKLMATGGYANVKNDYFARLFDVETGKEIRRFMHGQKGYGVRTLAFSPDGKTLATIGTQGGAFLRLFDVATGAERKAFPKDGDQRTTAGAVTFSPDGTTVAAAGATIRVYDAATGAERLRIDRAQTGSLHFTDGGRTLTAAVDGAVYRWDAKTGQALTPDAGDSGVAQVLVSADGRRVVTRGDGGDAHLWDGADGKRLRRIQARWQHNMAMSPDGRFLAWPVSDDSVTYTVPGETGATYHGSRIRLYDLTAGKTIDRFAAFKGDAVDIAFTADGKRLVTVDSRVGTVRTWNVETGMEEKSFVAVPPAPKGKEYRGGRATLAPDGSAVSLTFQVFDAGDRRLLEGFRDPPSEVTVWDVATGTRRPAVEGGHPVKGAFSPGGRFVVTQGENFVYETATGRQVVSLPEPYVQAAAFSRDGRYLATSAYGGVIQIWEVATLTKRTEIKGGPDQSPTLTFGPNGRLFCGSQDTTALAWDIRPPNVADEVSIDDAWAALAAKDAAESFKLEGRFLAAPAATAKYFAANVTPPAAVDPKQIQRLLADLGGDEFAVREAATKALAGLDHQVNAHLEAALTGAPSAEVRDRVKRILDLRNATAITLEQVRQLRAVTVLELIGDGDAKDLLKRWAAGPAGARLTTEAAAALTRQGAAGR